MMKLLNGSKSDTPDEIHHPDQVVSEDSMWEHVIDCPYIKGCEVEYGGVFGDDKFKVCLNIDINGNTSYIRTKHRDRLTAMLMAIEKTKKYNIMLGS